MKIYFFFAGFFSACGPRATFWICSKYSSPMVNIYILKPSTNALVSPGRFGQMSLLTSWSGTNVASGEIDHRTDLFWNENAFNLEWSFTTGALPSPWSPHSTADIRGSRQNRISRVLNTALWPQQNAAWLIIDLVPICFCFASPNLNNGLCTFNYGPLKSSSV